MSGNLKHDGRNPWVRRTTGLPDNTAARDIHPGSLLCPAPDAGSGPGVRSGRLRHRLRTGRPRRASGRPNGLFVPSGAGCIPPAAANPTTGSPSRRSRRANTGRGRPVAVSGTWTPFRTATAAVSDRGLRQRCPCSRMSHRRPCRPDAEHAHRDGLWPAVAAVPDWFVFALPGLSCPRRLRQGAPVHAGGRRAIGGRTPHPGLRSSRHRHSR
jgi:hypothetical protein